MELIVVLAMIAALGVVMCWPASRSRYDVSKIEVGFTKDQVRQILGEPESVYSGSSTAEEWVYTVPFKVYSSVTFDEKGHVTETYRHG